MLISDAGQVLTLIFLMVYDHLSSTAIWPILLAAFLIKTLIIVFETVATFLLIPSLVPAEKLGDANSVFLSALRLIQIIGPFLGGVFMSFIGFQICTLLNVLSYAGNSDFRLSNEESFGNDGAHEAERTLARETLGTSGSSKLLGKRELHLDLFAISSVHRNDVLLEPFLSGPRNSERDLLLQGAQGIYLVPIRARRLSLWSDGIPGILC